MGFLWRWLGAFGLTAAFFNPTEWNYVAWAKANFSSQMPFVLLVGLLLALGLGLYLMATLRSIGLLGIVLIAALFGLLLWLFYDWGWLGLTNSALNGWLALLGLSLIMGLGLSWSLIWQRASGQASVDEVDN
jgi:hypothetical protein